VDDGFPNVRRSESIDQLVAEFFDCGVVFCVRSDGSLLLGSSKIAIKAFRRRAVRGMCFFLAVVQTERMVFTARFDPSPPLVTLRVEMNALESGCVVSLLASVRLVLAALALAQITKAIVASIAIDVVDKQRQPAEHIQPSQSVSLMHDAINADQNVTAAFIDTSGRSSALAAALAPTEMTCVWIV
jgi:hypothetical protein